jgi:hypothetical protein
VDMVVVFVVGGRELGCFLVWYWVLFGLVVGVIWLFGGCYLWYRAAGLVLGVFLVW